MQNTRSNLVIVIFSLLCLIIGAFSLNEQTREAESEELQAVESVEETKFIDVNYYKLQNRKPSIELNSSELLITNETLLNFLAPFGTIINEERKIVYTAKSGEMNQVTEVLTLDGDVDLKDETSSYLSDNLQYFGATDQLFGTGNVRSIVVDEKTGDKINLTSDKLSSILKTKILTLTGSVTGKIQRKLRYQGKMDFSAEYVEVNSPESVVKLTNDVKIRRNNYHISAGNAEIFLENYNKKLKYYELYDDVELEEKLSLQGDKDQLRRAYAERLVAHQKTGRIVLSGAPRVEQGKDVIKGYQITLRENVELVEVDDSKSNFNMQRKKQ